MKMRCEMMEEILFVEEKAQPLNSKCCNHVLCNRRGLLLLLSQLDTFKNETNLIKFENISSRN